MFVRRRTVNAVCPAPPSCPRGAGGFGGNLLPPPARCSVEYHKEVVLAVITGWEPTGLPAGRRRRCWCRRRGRLINVRRRGRVRTGSRCSPQLESSEENQDENCDTA